MKVSSSLDLELQMKTGQFLKGNNDVNIKVSYFQYLIKTKDAESFPEKKVESCSNEKPYITRHLKKLIML